MCGQVVPPTIQVRGQALVHLLVAAIASLPFSRLEDIADLLFHLVRSGTAPGLMDSRGAQIWPPPTLRFDAGRSRRVDVSALVVAAWRAIRREKDQSRRCAGSFEQCSCSRRGCAEKQAVRDCTAD